jgi:hypothetical protein
LHNKSITVGGSSSSSIHSSLNSFKWINRIFYMS